MSSIPHPLFHPVAMLRARRQAPHWVAFEWQGDPTPQRMTKGATTWLVRPLGHEVCCEDGILWLCFDGEPLDIVLEPGESHLCQIRSPLSVHALSPAVMRVG